MNTDIRWQSYNFARHNIDLISANIVDIKATKSMSFSWGAKVINGLGLKQFVDEKSVKDDKFVVGLVYLTVKSNMDNGEEPSNENKIAEVNVIIRGVFEKKDSNMATKDFVKNVDLIMVPLLLPYGRTAISTISALFDGPAMSIPSMDIINSFPINGK